MSGGKASLGKTGTIGSGDRVEVLSSEVGFSDAWATAVCISHIKGSWLVEYSKFVDGDGKNLREKARSAPLGISAFCPGHTGMHARAAARLDIRAWVPPRAL